MWTIQFHQRRGDGPHQGSVGSLDEAMTAFRQAWDAGVGREPPWLAPGWEIVDGRPVKRGGAS
jgi:hypothetical protein